jgi:hypothetical protein
VPVSVERGPLRLPAVPAVSRLMLLLLLPLVLRSWSWQPAIMPTPPTANAAAADRTASFLVRM